LGHAPFQGNNKIIALLGNFIFQVKDLLVLAALFLFQLR